jgi:hypothetical protein
VFKLKEYTCKWICTRVYQNICDSMELMFENLSLVYWFYFV